MDTGGFRMNKKRKTMLAAAVCLAISGSCYAAENGTVTALGEDPDLQRFHLAEVVVSGRRYIAGEYVRAVSNVGILGKQDVMHSPISTTTISEKAVEDFMSSTEGLSKMLSLVPSVQKTYDAAVDCINIRGFSDSGRGFMVNGIPGMQAMTRQSTNYIDSVDVIEGPATGIKGSGNYVTAGGPLTLTAKKRKMTRIQTSD